MIVLFRLAQRYIARRFLQSLLFVVGVALGVAMVIAIDLANGSASRAFNLSTESITGRATHQITGGPTGLPSEVYTRLRIDLGLRDVAPVVSEYVRGVNLGDQPLRLLGVEPFAEPPFRDYLSDIEVAGENVNAFEALNAFIAEPNTLLMSQPLAERFGIESGDTITLRPGDTRVDVRVVGLLQPADRVSAQALDDLLLTDISTAQEIIGRVGYLTNIDLILPPDYDTSQITSILPPGVTLTTTQEANSTLAQMTAAFELNLQALSLLALTVGVFLIYNTVTFSVIQRRPIIGTLRALGATRRQIFALILGEAFILGLVGTIFGLGLGIIFGRGAVGLVSQTISDLYYTVNVQGVSVAPLTLVKGALIGLSASLGAALIPSFDATRTPPAGVLRATCAQTDAIRDTCRWCAGRNRLSAAANSDTEYHRRLRIAVRLCAGRGAANADCAVVVYAHRHTIDRRRVWGAGAHGSACCGSFVESHIGRCGCADCRRERDRGRERDDRELP
jgi:putative ABC transport system permease protein